VAATNRDLAPLIAEGKFGADLFERLAIVSIQLPPLRERPDDILPLSEAFLVDLARGFARPPAGVSREARQRLLEYAWPGNVRELRNVLERAAILCEGGLIGAEHLTLPAPRTARPETGDPAGTASVVSPPGIASDTDLMSAERRMVEKALQDARYNKSKAARALGLTRTQLYVRLRRHGLE